VFIQTRGQKHLTRFGGRRGTHIIVLALAEFPHAPDFLQWKVSFVRMKEDFFEELDGVVTPFFNQTPVFREGFAGEFDAFAGAFGGGLT